MPTIAGYAQSVTAVGCHVTKTIPIGADGGWDYMTIDAVARRLYVSHATKMVVVDIDHDTVVGALRNTPGIHGIVLAPALGRGYTSNGRDSSVTIFDLETLSVVGRVKVTGANPDAIHFDARTLKVTATHTLTGCDGPAGLTYDRARDRLFSVCGNRVLAVSNPTMGAVVSTIAIGSGADVVSYDDGERLLLASNGGDVTMSVIRQDSADHYTSLGSATTRVGSRTMPLDSKTHRAYLATVRYGPTPPPTAEQPRPRAPVIPGTFAILVLDRL